MKKITISIIVVFLLAAMLASCGPMPVTVVEPDIDLGVHGWGYILPTMARYPQQNAVISVLMNPAPYTYADLVAAAGWAGPTDSVISRLARKAPMATGANLLGYVPERNDTAPGVPAEECLYLEDYLPEFVQMGKTYNKTLNYGPGLSCVSSAFQHGRSYTLDKPRIAALAAMLPADSFWALRMFTPEQIYKRNPTGFGLAVKEYADAIHAGNPDVRIILHLSCQPGTEDQFMAYLEAARPYIDQAYMGIDFYQARDPLYDPEGTIATVTELLRRTGAVPVTPGPPTDTPEPPTATWTPTPTWTPTLTPTATRTPTRVPPTPTPGAAQVIPNLRYGEHERNLLDLYIPTAGHAPYPVVVWAHGGGLTSGDKSMERSKAQTLAAAGISVAAINYRLVPTTYMNQQVYDLKAAVRWVRANAAQYGLDPDQIGVAGGSAGAFLAATVATSCGVLELEGTVGPYEGQVSSCVQAGVVLAGIYSFPDYFLIQNPDGSLTSGGIRNQIRTCAKYPPDATPAECLQDGDANGKGDFYHCYVNQPACLAQLYLGSARYQVTTDDPPMFLLVGAEDETPGWFIDHHEFYSALVTAGVDATWHIEETPGCRTHGYMWSCVETMVVDWLVDHLIGMTCEDCHGGSPPPTWTPVPGVTPTPGEGCPGG